jgi:monofunctional biosynthetic peptidoglycan transglycosylase
MEQVGDGHFPTLHHGWVSIENVPAEMASAVMASEDQRFLTHHGFDFDAIQKAVKRNKAAGKNKFGASTISQQTAKNVFLWQGRSWLRKGLEMYFTILIEFVWGKERIMEVYLNSIEMGDGIYGVKAVARENFDKNVEDLSKSDCALIAATLPNPRRFSSKEPSAYMKKRQRQILAQMKFVQWK